jgi:hypothetical protein
MKPFTHIKPRNQWLCCSLCSRTPLLQSVRPTSSCSVARCAPVPEKHFLCPEILLPVGVLLWYLVLPCRDITAKYSTSSSKRFRCEVMLGVNTLSARTYTTFAPAKLLRNWREQRPSNNVTLIRVPQGMSGESISRGWTCFWFHFCVVVYGCCWTAF